jgi:hypothetical protein
MNYTLSYSEGVEGWPSFYSYHPDWMIGMNNYFYTFKGGNLYRHNVNTSRNIFYQPWWDRVDNVIPPNISAKAFTPTSITSVFNESVMENKLFKTIAYQGDSTWDITLITDLEYSGFIQSSWFQRKEAVYYAFVRNTSSGQLALRSVNGIGESLTVDFAFTNNAEVNFSINPLISIGNLLSIGDLIYFGTTTANYAGPVIDIIIDLPNGINRVVVNNNMLTPLTVPIPGDVNYFFFIKDSVAESHGVLGHYCKFTVTNLSSGKIELLSVDSEAMKSYP